MVVSTREKFYLVNGGKKRGKKIDKKVFMCVK